MPSDPVALILLYFILPLWLAAGMADWLCHRAARIETTAGAKESLIHLLMFAEAGVPLLAALLLEINALIILVAIIAFLLHAATALWDVRYATAVRDVTPIEQHVHNYLEMIPLTAILSIVALHWGQFLALFDTGGEHARFDLAWKRQPLPAAYLATMLTLILLLELVPYGEEYLRGRAAAARGMRHGREPPPRQ